MTLNRPIKEAWRANIKVNSALLEHLTPEMLGAQTPGGGDTVAQHLAHITGTVKYWGCQLDEARLGSLADLYDKNAYDKDAATFIAETDLTRIREVMTETARTALEAVSDKPEGDKGDLPHSSAQGFLVHMMVHDAHHRGQILLALKTSGHPLPDEDLLWGPWRGE
jgi:uncharacterized damage-inducible protein DinB